MNALRILVVTGVISLVLVGVALAVAGGPI